MKNFTRADREIALQEYLSDRSNTSLRNKMIVANMGLVRHIAKRYRYDYADHDDVIQMGSTGLMRALETFDPTICEGFSTYAAYWIRARIGRFLSTLKGQRASVLSTEAWKNNTPPMLSLDCRIRARNGEEGDLTLLENVPSDLPPPDDIFEHKEAAKRAQKIIDVALAEIGDPRANIVMKYRMQQEAATFDDIGKMLGLSREKVRQIELKVRAHIIARYAA